MFKFLKNLIFPGEHICLFCRENMAEPSKYICDSCREFIEISNSEVNLGLPNIDKIYYSCFYNRLIRKQLHSYKFEGKSYLYKPFGEMLIDTIEEKGLKEKIDVIVCVPAHNRKKALRGYNQSELLASYIAGNLNIPLLKKHLLKTKWTIDQNKLDRIERKTNLKNSFKTINIEDFRDKEILLIDDIITTGTTMEECARVLVESGAKTVYGLALTSSMTK